MGLALTTRRRLGAALLVTATATATCLAATQALAGPSVLGQAANTVEATAANQFSPKTLTVAAGTEVTWTNPAGGFHSVTGGTPAAKDTSKINQPIAAFPSYSVTFDKAGTFPYFCEPHASTGMTGEIIVTAAGAPGATGSASPAPGGSSPTSGPSESGVAASSPTPAPVQGEEGHEGEASHIPNIDDNEVLKRIEAEEASNKTKVKGFQTLLWGMIAAMVALGIALFLSTRPRRANR